MTEASIDIGLEHYDPQLRLNTLLTEAGLDLRRTRLVRHQDNRALAGRSPYELWRAQDGRFELYQSIQRKPRFRKAQWIVSFVATPLNETVFVGVYRVVSVGDAPMGMCDPISNAEVGGYHLYELRLAPDLSNYAGRLIVDWGQGYRSWVQRPSVLNKPILELRRTAHEPPFPGFADFRWPIKELGSVPQSWRAALSAVSGVYLLVCTNTGRQYIGSATGEGGLWARWEQYLRTGHGGNEGMKLEPGNEYQVSILEFDASSVTYADLLVMEGRWKDKLLTRRFGLNRN